MVHPIPAVVVAPRQIRAVGLALQEAGKAAARRVAAGGVAADGPGRVGIRAIRVMAPPAVALLPEAAVARRAAVEAVAGEAAAAGGLLESGPARAAIGCRAAAAMK